MDYFSIAKFVYDIDSWVIFLFIRQHKISLLNIVSERTQTGDLMCLGTLTAQLGWDSNHWTSNGPEYFKVVYRRYPNKAYLQCNQILAWFRHFGKNVNKSGNILKVYLAFWTILKVLWQILYAFGQMFIVLNSHKMKK